jgi:hypothetical protein
MLTCRLYVIARIPAVDHRTTIECLQGNVLEKEVYATTWHRCLAYFLSFRKIKLGFEDYLPVSLSVSVCVSPLTTFERLSQSL